MTEDAVHRGLITRAAGQSLLAKYHVPMSPPSKVYTGSPQEALQQGQLHVEAVSDHLDRVGAFLKHRKI